MHGLDSVFLSVSDAARTLCVSRQTVYTWIADGYLLTERFAGRQVVLRSSVDARKAAMVAARGRLDSDIPAPAA